MSLHLAQVRHVFTAQKIPTDYELHCWHAHQFQKQQKSFKIQRNGRVLHLICQEGAIEPHSVKLETNSFTYKRTEEAEGFGIQKGDVVTLSGTMCYVINRHDVDTGKKFTESPLDNEGRLKRHTKRHLYDYLQKSTGISSSGQSRAVIEVVGLPLTPEERKGKIHFEGRFEFSIRGLVEQPEKVEQLAFNGIGRRRSYGYGAIQIGSIDRAKPAQ